MKPRDPSVKQQKYLANLVDMVEKVGNVDKSTKELAATNAGYSDAVAKNVKDKIEKTPSFQKLLRKTFNNSRIKKKLMEGINAKTVKTATHEGIITDEKEYPDHATRLKYLEFISKLLGETQGSIEYQRRTRKEDLPGDEGTSTRPSGRINVLRQDIKVYLGQPIAGKAQRIIDQ